MDQLRKDVVFGLRMLRKRPGTTALAVTALALGIGLTTTMFSIVNGAFLRGLPFDRADRIVYAGELVRDRGDGRPGGMPVGDYLDYTKSQTALEEIGAFTGLTADVASEGVSPARYSGARVSTNTLHILRVRPAIGRDFVEEDGADSAPPVVIISDVIWANQFGRDPGILHQVIRVNGQAASVIGVMGPRFGFPQQENLWMPLIAHPAAKRADSLRVDVFGRLSDGASVADASRQVAAVAARVAASDPDAKNLTGSAVPFVRRYLGTQVIVTLSTMLAAVFGVLLIACVNVTNLQLARAAERVREVGIRLAMGASRGRMIRQLLVEGLMLAALDSKEVKSLIIALGTAIGLAIAEAGVRLFMAGIADTNPPFWIVANLDTRVLLFAAALTIVAALASSLVPAFRVTRQDLHSVLKDSGRANTSLSMGRFTSVLVVAEIMLSFVLLVVSGLMIKSVLEVNRIDFPFRTDRFHARVELVERDYQDEAAVRLTTERLVQSLSGTAGINGVALATALPDRAAEFGVLIDGEAKPVKSADMRVARRMGVTPEFFGVMGVKALQGRLIDSRDREDQLKVAVVSEDFAQKFYPKGDAIGHRVQLQLQSSADNAWWTIVGIVPRLTIAAGESSQETTELVIVPMTQLNSRNVLILASAPSGDPLSITTAVRTAVASINPDLPLFEVDTVAGIYRAQTWPFRVFGSLFMSFGLAALLMAAAGLYGVMAFSVRRRTQEIGVRMALGADRGRILRMVMRHGAILVGVGMVLGIGIGGWLGGQLQLLLFGVKPWDLTVFGLTAFVLGSAGLLSSFLPARRAASVDPLVALRNE